MPSLHSTAKSGATCLLCVPLRLGVFIAAILTSVGSIGVIYLKQHFTVQSRMLFGGYTFLSALFGKVVDYVGVVWGIWGLIGCWQMKEGYLAMYNYYNMFRVATWVYMLYSDFPLLWNCEAWTLDLDNTVKANGWNETMYRVATGGQCVATRFYFNTFVPLGCLLFLYLIWINIQLQRLIGSEPAYLLRLPAVKLDPAFYSYSLGERTALLGQRSDRRGDLPMTRGDTASGTEASAHAKSAESHGQKSESQSGNNPNQPLWKDHYKPEDTNKKLPEP